MRATKKQITKIVNLLEHTTTRKVVGNFLREHDIPYSASSWREILEVRIIPAIKDKKIRLEELIQLLANAEEHGKQHIFLYECSSQSAQEFISKERIENILTGRNENAILAEPRVLDKVDSPTIADVRWEADGATTYLVIKYVETRVSEKLLGQTMKGKRLYKEYEVSKERAVNLARLSSNGQLEIRIASHSSSTKYYSDLKSFWSLLGELIPKASFYEISLSTAKETLITDHDKLAGRIRYTDVKLIDDYGVLLSVAAGSHHSNLQDNTGAQSSVNAFQSHGAHGDSTNIWFKQNGSPVLNGEMHVRIAGEVNEFAIPGKCVRAEYEYILSEIRALNQKISR